MLKFHGLAESVLAQEATPLSALERERLVNDVQHELFGLGPLEPLLADPTISDILVNSHRTIYVERRGKIESTNVAFKDDEHLMRVIERIVSSVGRRIDESSPMVDARLKRWLTRQCNHSAAVNRWPDSFDSPIRI